MTKKEMLNALIEHYASGNKSKFAKKIGLSAQGLSTWITRNTFDIDLLYSKCENISAEWLLTGTGSMLATPISHNEYGIAEASDIATGAETRPRIPFEAAAGGLSIALNGVSESECEQMPVIASLPRYDFTIIARGNSMQPDILSGDEIACSFVQNSTFIQWGQTHVLDTAQGVVVKRIFDDRDMIVCKSNNPDFPDFSIPKNEIYHMAIVVGLIRHF